MLSWSLTLNSTSIPIGAANCSRPAEAALRTRLNGRVVQEARLGEMIFGVPRIIAHISRFATLRAGDVIATGTPSGVAPVHDGDSVEVEIEGIGVLRNRFVGSED